MILKTEQKQEKCIVVQTKIYIFSHMFLSLIVNKQILSNLLNYKNNISTVSGFRRATCSKPNKKIIDMTNWIFFPTIVIFFLLSEWHSKRGRKRKKPFVLQHAVHDIQHPLLEYTITLFWSYCNFYLQIKNKIISTKMRGKNKTLVYKHILNIWQFNDQILVHPWILHGSCTKSHRYVKKEM